VIMRNTYKRSISMSSIVDGTSTTILFAERMVPIPCYTATGDGQRDCRSDNASYIAGTFSWGHNGRSCFDPPLRDPVAIPDRLGGGPADDDLSFGAAHAATFHSVMADGSTRPISYSIDRVTFMRLGRRNDGGAVQLPE
jgi:hypothetical protein